MNSIISLLLISIALVGAYPAVNQPRYQRPVPIPRTQTAAPRYPQPSQPMWSSWNRAHPSTYQRPNPRAQPTAPRSLQPFQPMWSSWNRAPPSTYQRPNPRTQPTAPRSLQPSQPMWSSWNRAPPSTYQRPNPRTQPTAPRSLQPSQPMWSSWNRAPPSRPWWYGRTSRGRPVIGVTNDGRPITDPQQMSNTRRSIFTRARGNPVRNRRPESHSSGDSISFEFRRPGFGSDKTSFSRSSEGWESWSDEDFPTRRRVRLITDHLGRQMLELVPSSESNSSGDSISHEDTWFGPHGSYSASSGSQSSSMDFDGK